jgi:hypothetical protein
MENLAGDYPALLPCTTQSELRPTEGVPFASALE